MEVHLITSISATKKLLSFGVLIWFLRSIEIIINSMEYYGKVFPRIDWHLHCETEKMGKVTSKITWYFDKWHIKTTKTFFIISKPWFHQLNLINWFVRVIYRNFEPLYIRQIIATSISRKYCVSINDLNFTSKKNEWFHSEETRTQDRFN